MEIDESWGKVGVFYGFLRFLKKGSRRNGSVFSTGEIDVNPFVSAD